VVSEILDEGESDCHSDDTLVDTQLFRTSAGAIKDTPTWPVPGPPVWRGVGNGDDLQLGLQMTDKGNARFIDESEYIDLTVPAPEYF
jgi:hypothetical protein